MTTTPDPRPGASPEAARPLLAIDGLQVEFPRLGSSGLRVVDEVALDIRPGEILALVGESGSGKTMVGRSILGLLPPHGRITAGRILFEGRDLLSLPPAEMRRLRGDRIGMVFQEPLVSLNPSLTIGYQMAEAAKLHRGLGGREVRAASLEMLERVRIDEPARCLKQYPHQFSGGMRQRIMLASVLMLRPSLLIADEPTTALDAVIQQEVLDIMQEVVRDLGTAVLLISHDLGVVATYAQRVAVMQHGRLVEQGSAQGILLHPRQPYTRALLEALPRRDPQRRPRGGGEMLLRAEGLSVDFLGRRTWPWQPRSRHRAVAAMELTVRRGETLGVVGESGSGKTTLGRALLRLLPAAAGRVELGGRDLLALDAAALRRVRQKAQIVFQDPYSSLDPRMRVAALVGEGLRQAWPLGAAERRERVAAVLEDVGLGGNYAGRYPHELSGGQRQRVSIARALVSRPDFVVADEPVSALDVTVQAQILRLLRALQEKYGFTCLFISHDLGVIEQVCDRVMVMKRGRVLEHGETGHVFDAPRHPYTCRLLEAVPQLEQVPGGPGYRIRRRKVSPPPPPAGYLYFEDDAEAPVMVAVGPGHEVACTPSPRTPSLP